MSETTALAQTIVGLVRDAVASLQTPLRRGKLADVRVSAKTGLLSGVSVDLPSGRTECTWLGAFQAEVTDHPEGVVGMDCEVAIYDGAAVVHGVIWTGA